ncbi:hypothetical protein UAW_02138 [Enterococcus haemoperoxidus ATCC BAA-382]|uniref:Uncharacterized protein n=1 Tax=Enterococcus haemoperoxidus ATCC BAA-382 TaxID=1158608 RepID=R2T495_9ENTE|nr:hypothetical protein [Enterococcus haemoperoxidus]EOH95059.1 hypothetical protein UAW_02138 [Enterococcus haemoperoxidus ATCC BAA-382]EOT60458.1 hypothetical protein I583_03104 [Enterococcus haemoperoxidus ATCC BAA-382]
MIYVISGCIIFATHYLLKENQWLFQKKLWQLVIGTILLVSVAVLLSTWIGSLFPVIAVTLICATMLQIKYTHQLATQRLS